MIAQFDAKGRRSLAIAASLGLIVGALSLSGATRAADPPAGGPPPATKTKTVEKGTTAVTESKTTAVPGSDAAGTTNNPNAAGAGSPPPSPVVPTATAVPSGSTVALQSGTFTIAATPPSPEEQKANARTAERLKKPLQKVDFNAVPLSDVIDFLRDATGMDILVEWPALEQAGIPRDAPITIRLREPTPVDALLPLMFRASGLPLRYEIDKGVVVIGPSATTQAGPPVTRVYDVADLVAGAPVPPPPGSFRPGAEGAGGAGGGAAAPMPEDTSEAGQLIRLITSTIEPTSWRDAGGELGSISFFKSKLVVKTSEPIHKEIANLLEMLREKPAGKEKSKPGF